MEVNDVVLTAILTLLGTILLEIIKRWLMRNKEKTDDATQIRSELREDAVRLRADLREADEALDKWRNENLELKSRLLRAQADLADTMEIIRSRSTMTDVQIDEEVQNIKDRAK